MITETKLVSLVSPFDTFFELESVEGIPPSDAAKGAITRLHIGREVMQVSHTHEKIVFVARGLEGTPALSHRAGSQVLAGLPWEFDAQRRKAQ